MRKIYIGFISLLILGIGAGIFYLQVIRPGTAELPDDIILQTAFEDEYSFENLPSKARLIEFMYTKCPDVCPVTTFEMAKLRNRLIDEGVFGDKVEFLTITINPDQDTAEILRSYAGRFEVTSSDDGWQFLRGSDEDTKEIADSLGFLYRDPGTGDIIHSTFTYFLDDKNNLLDKFPMGQGFNTEKVYNRIMKVIN